MKKIFFIIFILSNALNLRAITNQDSLSILQLKEQIFGKIDQGFTYEEVKKRTILGMLTSTRPVPAKIDGQLNDLLSLYQKAYSARSPQYAEALTWCAWVCAKAGDRKQANKLLKEADRRFKKYGQGTFNGRDTINQIYYNDVRSFLEEQSGRDFVATRIAKKNVDLKRLYYGVNHSVYLSSLLELSRLYAARLCMDKSRKYHNLGYNSYIELLKREFCSTSESERTLYWNTAIKYINKTIDLAYRQSSKTIGNTEQSLASAAYNALLLSKGLLLNTTISFEQFIANSGNPIAKWNLQYKKLRMSEGADQAELDSLDYVILDALKNDGQNFELPQLSISWEDVAGNLEKDDVAIEFYRTAEGNYGAVVIKKDWKAPKCIKIGSYVEKNIDKDLLSQMKKKEKREATILNLNKALSLCRVEDETIFDSDLAWRVSRAVWTDELLKYFPQTRDGRIFFAADGELQITGVEYLPFLDPEKQYRNDGSYYCLADLFTVYRLSSTRELVTHGQHENGKGAAIYGGLVYSMGDSLLIADNERYKRDTSERMLMAQNGVKRGFGGLYELDGSQIEADSITNIINSKRLPDIQAQLFTKERGTEASFKAFDGKQMRLMHIATHGFYFTEKDSIEYMDFLGSTQVHPMSRSGLIMSGAETKYYGGELPLGVEDGILTSLEISSLDLRGLDLVTLSACQTGQGDIGSDGVFGLQRGFKMASANSIMMSLWKVDDDATQAFMTCFYSEWTSGKIKDKLLRLREIM